MSVLTCCDLQTNACVYSRETYFVTPVTYGAHCKATKRLDKASDEFQRRLVYSISLSDCDQTWLIHHNTLTLDFTSRACLWFATFLCFWMRTPSSIWLWYQPWKAKGIRRLSWVGLAGWLKTVTHPSIKGRTYRVTSLIQVKSSSL